MCEHVRDPSPAIENGKDYDGKNLLHLLRCGISPFRKEWDVNQLLKEIEENLELKVDDIIFVSYGANYYGFHIKLSTGKEVVARLSRSDLNMPGYRGFSIDQLVPEVKFEVAVNKFLQLQDGLMTSYLLYYRIPVKYIESTTTIPQDIAGRRLFIFERAEGEKNVWRDLSPTHKKNILEQSAYIRASLFELYISPEFAESWLHTRLFEQKPKSFPTDVDSTRNFCIALFKSKIEATIGEIGEMIGWESDNETVGPIASAAKQTLLNFIIHMLPMETNPPTLYRLVLEHGDFGIHNMLIKENTITSLFDWDAGYITLAFLSDLSMAVSGVDLVINENLSGSYIVRKDEATQDDHEQYKAWASQYCNAFSKKVPEYQRIMEAGKDARYLWFTLKEWKGGNSEEFFGKLSTWAATRMQELGIHSVVTDCV